MPSHRASVTTLFLASTLVAFAHGGCTIQPSTTPADASTPTDATATDGGAADRGECTDYTPAKVDAAKSGTFASAQDVVKLPLPTTDVGGGLLAITMKATSQPFEVGVWLLEGDKASEQRTEADVDADGTASYTARLAGGKTYELRITPLDFRADKANGYGVEAKYEPLVDCYEGNDTRAAAKRIPTDRAITAHLHAGIGPNDSRLVGPTGDDWYWFELAEPKKVSLALTIPGESTAYFQLRDAKDEVVRCEDPNESVEMPGTETRETFTTCAASLEAGRYWVRAGLANSEEPSTGPNLAVPKSWREPYTLTVVTR